MSSGPTLQEAPADETEAPKGTLAFIWDAVRGSRQDLTRVPIGRAILLLAIPMVLEMGMESIFAVVDIFWVSKLGPDAVAAVGLTESMLTVIYGVAMGLSMGVGAVVARRIGEKDREGASRAAVQAIVLGVGLAAIVGVVGALMGPRLLAAMGAEPGAIATGSGYTRMMLAGSVTIVLLFLINAAFRGAGDASIAMRTLILANGINIVLAPFLVFGWGPFPQLGVTGAAVATTIGRGIGVLYQLRALARGRGWLGIARRHLAIDGEVLRTIVRISKAGVVQVLIGMASWIVLMRILSGFGSLALAGYTISVRIVMFALLPSWGMANAAATLVGQNLGARQPDRAEQAVWRAALYNLFFLGAVGALFVVFATPIVRIFTSEPEVVRYGADCLRIVSAGFLLYAYGMVLGQSFNGAGDTRTPTLINLLCFWVVELPLAYVLSRPLGMGPRGVFVSITIAFSLSAIVGGVLFRRGKWKKIAL